MCSLFLITIRLYVKKNYFCKVLSQFLKMSNLVIVESPAKASTIEKILGKDFKVVSSYGHIRDLEKKNMGIDLKGSFEPQYCVSADKKKILQSLIKESKKSNTIWLATDEDREGEAIAWHLFESLELQDKNVNRIVFHEITASAIKKAVANPRSIDINLVNAQQARRILDRIVGFKLSPILWKKVKSGLSAGRVQSVAVRLIVEREKKISVFKPIKSFQISADFFAKNSESFNAIMLNDVIEKNTAKSLLESFVNKKFIINSIDTKPSFSAPSSPFTTSILQQVASSRLGFSVARTMSVAQKFYESGHITYMRTDSTNLSKDSMNAIESYIVSNYGLDYYKARKYSTKTKVAQEAHEAIRPTQFNNLICGKDDAQKRLYQLIWERTICSQMSDAVIDKTIVSINVPNKENSVFQAKGQIVKFDGYLKVQKQLMSSQKKDKLLPNLKEGDSLDYKSIVAKEKYSKPPSRFTEASLVKKLEELGIGRPSTYAPTISTIQKREYVVKDDVEGRKIDHAHLILEQNNVIEKTVLDLIGSEKKKLLPTEIGRLTTEFLVEHFKDILEYNFTAKVESQFDDVAMGKKEWKNLIKTFYTQFEPTVLNADQNSDKITGQRELGVDPNTGKNIYVRLGKYGPIVQMGDVVEGEDKPKYAKLRKGQSIDLINLEMALELFKLPRTVGVIVNKDVIVSEGKYGPYVRYDNNFVSLGDLDPMTITLEECVKLIEKKREFDKQKIINSFNFDNTNIQVCNGKYGPYIKYNKKNYKIPKETDPHKLTKDDCLNLIQKSSKK